MVTINSNGDGLLYLDFEGVQKEIKFKNIDLSIDDTENGLVTLEIDIDLDGVEIANLIRFVHIDPSHLDNRDNPFEYEMGNDTDADVTVTWHDCDVALQFINAVHDEDQYLADISQWYCKKYLKDNLRDAWVECGGI